MNLNLSHLISTGLPGRGVELIPCLNCADYERFACSSLMAPFWTRGLVLFLLGCVLGRSYLVPIFRSIMGEDMRTRASQGRKGVALPPGRLAREKRGGATITLGTLPRRLERHVQICGGLPAPEASNAVRNGRVQMGGRTTTDVLSLVVPTTDTVCLDGKVLVSPESAENLPEDTRVFALHKPRGMKMDMQFRHKNRARCLRSAVERMGCSDGLMPIGQVQ